MTSSLARHSSNMADSTHVLYLLHDGSSRSLLAMHSSYFMWIMYGWHDSPAKPLSWQASKSAVLALWILSENSTSSPIAKPIRAIAVREADTTIME
ncbi:hypothetical protein CENSYa_0513 [Cenarchaeum symbiosum A]|uniref:Uncharacterized protein n=1 Tax=Cenarchaeum symbiosum (strain A) TaxID=414004 RepID=A0RUX9_CENSY|nr:hypothetical protein CENSYa_0513 [Cenarchaeum symbiosum A]